MHIGTKYVSAPESDYFSGRLDDVRIYSRALTQEEIEDLVCSGILVSMEILGPDEVAKNSTVQYKAIAHYDDGSTRDVSDSAEWSVVPGGYASIDNKGNLTTADIEKFQNVKLTARYSAGGVTVQSEKNLVIYSVCPTGYALRFDGTDDFVAVPRGVSLEPEEITVEMWAFLEGEQTGNTRLLRKAGDFGNGYMLAADEQGDHLMQFRIDNEGLARAADTKSHAAYVGAWHHFAGVYMKNYVIFYVDGIEVGRSNHDRGSMKHNPLTDLCIGGGLPSRDASEFYKGKIDEVRIWNGERSLLQIQIMMHQRVQWNEAGLIAYRNIYEGAGQVAHDLSSNGNDGQLGSTAGVDSSDPQWVASDAPVGVCTPYVIAVSDIRSAITTKLQVLTALENSIENEQKAIESLREMMSSGDLGGLRRTDILKSMADIRLAIVQEQVSVVAVRQSVTRLEEALSFLGVDVTPHQWPGLPIELPDHNPADVNYDGVVNLLDLAILAENWNEAN